MKYRYCDSNFGLRNSIFGSEKCIYSFAPRKQFYEKIIMSIKSQQRESAEILMKNGELLI